MNAGSVHVMRFPNLVQVVRAFKGSKVILRFDYNLYLGDYRHMSKINVSASRKYLYYYLS